jgi:hypothetical protein
MGSAGVVTSAAGVATGAAGVATGAMQGTAVGAWRAVMLARRIGRSKTGELAAGAWRNTTTRRAPPKEVRAHPPSSGCV